MMTQVSIHNDDEVSSRMRHPVHIGRAQSQLSRSRSQEDLVLAVNLHQLLCDVLRAIGTVVVDDDDFKIYFAETSEIVFD